MFILTLGEELKALVFVKGEFGHVGCKKPHFELETVDVAVQAYHVAFELLLLSLILRGELIGLGSEDLPVVVHGSLWADDGVGVWTWCLSLAISLGVGLLNRSLVPDTVLLGSSCGSAGEECEARDRSLAEEVDTPILELSVLVGAELLLDWVEPELHEELELVGVVIVDGPSFHIAR